MQRLLSTHSAVTLPTCPLIETTAFEPCALTYPRVRELIAGSK